MAQDVVAETKAHDLAVEPGVLHGVVDRRRAQAAGESPEAVEISGRRIAMAAAEAEDPAISLDGPEQRTPGTAGRRPAEGHDRFPIRRRVIRYMENAGRIGL